MEIEDVIKSIVDLTKFESNILSITDNLNNTYTVYCSDVSNFKVNRYIQLLNTSGFTDNYLIQTINTLNNSFTISKTSGQAITTLGKVKSLYPYFAFEKFLPEANELSLKDFDLTAKYKKFPLIFLLLDISENRNLNLHYNSEINNLKIYIITNTEQNKSASWRKINTFDSDLIPIYNLFLQNLENCPYLFDTQKITFEYVKRYYLGSADKNQNKLNQLVDCIELTINGIKIKTNIKQCII